MTAGAAALDAAARTELRAALAAIRCTALLARRHARSPWVRAVAEAIVATVRRADRAVARLDAGRASY